MTARSHLEQRRFRLTLAALALSLLSSLALGLPPVAAFAVASPAWLAALAVRRRWVGDGLPVVSAATLATWLGALLLLLPFPPLGLAHVPSAVLLTLANRAPRPDG